MKLIGFIKPPIFNRKIISNKNVIRMMNPLPGLEIGVPLNIFQDIFTNIHFGKDIVTSELVILQFAIGYFTYGTDRFLDSQDEIDIEKSKKKELYHYLNENKKFIISTLMISYFYIISELTKLHDGLPLIFILSSTLQYKNFKTLFGEFKAVYIATMWTLSAIILPSIIYDGNYDILNYPLDYLPAFLTLFASSNIIDTKDIEEDKMNNINTLPVVLGERKSYMLSLLAIALSSFIFGTNQNYYNRPIINSIFELQNAGLAFVPLIDTNYSYITNLINNSNSTI